jgi:long-subunit fatty acid transport protein
VGRTVRKALLSVENEYYWHDSNDARNDFYDSQVWKITSSASGNVTKKLYVSGSFAFERKNYEARPLTGFTSPVRYDDKYTLSSSLTYDFNKTWKVSPSLQFDHLASNESTGEYDNMKYACTLTARF